MATTASADDGRNVSLPAQPLSSSLQAIAQRFGIELLFSQDMLAGRSAPAISGRFNSKRALELVLAGSNLTIRLTASGSYLIVQTESSADAQPEAVPEILVIGHRTQNADIRRYETDVQPYQVVTRREVQQSHASNVEELIGKRLSANAQAATLTQTPSEARGFVRSSIDLRGLGTDQTLVLVDGRRMPRLPSATGDLSFIQPDVNGLPPEALERVEVITSTAGGIYGPGATAGVVNLVLAREYRGAEVAATRGITGRGDAAYERIYGRLGFTPDHGDTNVMVSFGASRSEGLRVGDRNYEARARAMRLENNPDGIGSSSVPLSGSINIVGQGSSNLVLRPEYGGAALNSRFASISIADRRSAAGLAADIMAGAGKLDLAPAPGPGGGDDPILTPRSATSVQANIRHRFGERLEGYVDLIRLTTSGRTSFNGVSSIPLGLGSTNPFRQRVSINLPVTILSSEGSSKVKTTRFTGGVLADLPWRWKATVDYSIGAGEAVLSEHAEGINGYSALIQGGDAVRRLNPLGDVSTLIAELATYPGSIDVNYHLISRFRDASIRLAGPVVQLPGGPLFATLLAEDRREHVPSRSIRNFYVLDSRLILPRLTETVRSFYGEIRAPLLDSEKGFPLLRGLELQLALRNDRTSLQAPNNTNILNLVLGSNTDTVKVRRAATMYTAGFRVRPSSSVMLRASIATGDLPLTAEQISTAVEPSPYLFIPDPRRGGEWAGTDNQADVLSGGSRNISAERSRSLSFGLVLTPPREAGLRLSLDYTRIDKRNEISDVYSGKPGYFLANEAAFPDRVSRLPLTASDAAAGYTVGVVTKIDTTYFNVGRTRIDAVDLKIDYRWPTDSLGEFTFHSALSWQPRYTRVEAPGQPVLDYVSTPDGALRWRGNGALGWAKGDFAVVLTGQYYGGYSVRRAGFDYFNDEDALEQGAERIRAQTTLDLALSYRVNIERGAARPHGLEFRLGIQDLLDRPAPIMTNAGAGYSYYADPRRRRFELTVAAGF
jgi:outer membrane receptor protein involved in Fe transport